MKEFLLLLNDVITGYRKRIEFHSHNPKMRLELMKNMHDELKQLKDTFEMLHPKSEPNGAKWDDVVATLSNN